MRFIIIALLISSCSEKVDDGCREMILAPGGKCIHKNHRIEDIVTKVEKANSTVNVESVVICRCKD